MKNHFDILLKKFQSIGEQEEDTTEDKLNHLAIIYLGLSMSVGGIIWGSICIYFELYVQAAIPYGYALITALNFCFFYFSKNFSMTKVVQVFISLLLPFLFQWSLGGFLASGGVMLWALLSLVGTVTIHSTRTTVVWLVFYLILTVSSGLIDHQVIKLGIPISTSLSTFFFVVNIAVISSFVTALTIFFVSKQKKVQKELIKSEQETKAIVNNIAEGVINFDIQGSIQFVNPVICKMFGYEEKELLGHNVVALMHKSVIKDFIDYIENDIIKKNRIAAQAKELLAIHQNGSSFPIELNVTAMQRGHEKIFIGILHNISQRIADKKRLQKAVIEAEKANKSKSAFLANMSHEIRTPMNAVIGLSDLCLKTSLSEKQFDYVHKVNVAGESLLRIINDILDFSKIEAGKLDIEQVPFTLEKVLSNLATILQVKTEDKDIDLLFYRSMNVPEYFIGDPLRLEQILINLVNNAVKFTQKGEIIVSIKAMISKPSSSQQMSQSYLQFSVQDTGIGMTKKQCNNLFAAFSQADISTTRKYGGTGLGLVISKQLIEMMGGKIEVSSKLGVGSLFTFTVRLGLTKEHAARPLKAYLPLQSLRVLIYESNHSALQIIENYLVSLGCIVIAVDQQEKVIPALTNSREPFRLIICELDKHFIERKLLKKLQSLAIRPKLVLLSSTLNHKLSHEIENKLTLQVINKPFTPIILHSAILACLHNQKSVKKRLQREDLIDLSPIHGARILLVEDNLINQQIALEVLTAQHFRVDIANNGQEAINMLEPGRYECILMDIQMPVMDGYTATKTIRQDANYQELPILAMTASAMVDDQKASQNVGMDGHISKPINQKELFQTLLDCIKPHNNRYKIAIEQKRVDDLSENLVEYRSAIDFDANKKPINKESKKHYFNQEPANNKKVDIPVIPNVNVEKALSYFNNSIVTYDKLIEIFLSTRTEVNAISLIEQAMKDNKLDEAIRLAHTMKSVMANLGVERLSQQAAVMEKRFEQGHIPNAQFIQQCKLDVNNLVKSLKLYLAGKKQKKIQANKTPINLPVTQEQLDELKGMIEDFNAEAENYLDNLLENYSSQSIIDELYLIKEDLLDFDFDGALLKVQSLVL